jgi:hypothetical protein
VILSPQNCSGPEYIASKDINKDSLHHRQDTIQAAASYLREDITTHAENLQEMVWPPTIEQLSTEERKPPESVRKFYESILSCNNINASRLADSFSQDLVHGVTKGKTIMEKHFLIGLGIHNLTGQRNVVEILNKFGHSVSYTMASEILTANAESCLEKSRLTSLLPLYPLNAGEIVLTHFWVDNFDLATDKQYGGGEINITTLMAFQEGRTLEDRNVHVHVPRKASRKISSEDLAPIPKKVDNQIQPPTCSMEIVPEQFVFDDRKFMTFYFAWIIARRDSSSDQVIPIFSSFMTNARKTTDPLVTKTVETYLPPINSKVSITLPHLSVSYMLSMLKYATLSMFIKSLIITF